MKKLAVLSALVLGMIGAIAAAPAFADGIVYDNTGPGSYATNAYTINYGYAVADSFTLSSTSPITSVNFVVWDSSGSPLTSMDWLITTDSFGGTTEGSGTAHPTGTYIQNNSGYNLYNEDFSIAGLSLDAGTYYLQLQNALAPGGSYVFWDESDGPSTAAQNGTPMPSETFQILAPEPSSFLLLGSGLLGLAGLLKRKLRA